MAYNDKKILTVLIGEVLKIPDRCEGYRTEMKHLLVDVLSHERDHVFSRTNIVQKIGDSINAVGIFLHKNRKDI